MHRSTRSELQAQESRSEFRRSQFKRAISHQPQDYKAWTGFKSKAFRVASAVVLPKNQRQCTPTIRPLGGTTRSRCKTPQGTVRLRAITEPCQSYEGEPELPLDIDDKHDDHSKGEEKKTKKSGRNNFAVGLNFNRRFLSPDTTDSQVPPTVATDDFHLRILLPNYDDNQILESDTISGYSSSSIGINKSKLVSISLPKVPLVAKRKDSIIPATFKSPHYGYQIEQSEQIKTEPIKDFEDSDSDNEEDNFEIEMLDDGSDGGYFHIDFYDCMPPPIFMFFITIVEIGFFVFHTQTFLNDPNIGYISKYGPFPLDSVLIYNPTKRYEVWRYFTYAFVHSGYMHIVNNILIQLALGILLEMVHKWWRVLPIYFSGVLAGSLATSISDPFNYLAGASAGVYALIAAHLSTVILNWTEMEYPWIRVLIVTAFVIHDAGTALYLGEKTNVGYAAHLGGAIAGLLVGICILRNYKWEKWESVLWYSSVVLCALIFIFAILWNIVMTDLFPKTY